MSCSPDHVHVPLGAGVVQRRVPLLRSRRGIKDLFGGLNADHCRPRSWKRGGRDNLAATASRGGSVPCLLHSHGEQYLVSQPPAAAARRPAASTRLAGCMGRLHGVDHTSRWPHTPCRRRSRLPPQRPALGRPPAPLQEGCVAPISTWLQPQCWADRHGSAATTAPHRAPQKRAWWEVAR